MNDEIELTKSDMIQDVITNEDGTVAQVVLQDGNKFTFKQFIELFKQHLRTIVAGEVITWDDEWRYQRQIDPKTMEQYLDIVEAEGLVANSKFNLTRAQKISIGVIIILVFVGVFALIALKNAGLLG